MIKTICLKCKYHKVLYHKNIEPAIYCNYKRNTFEPINMLTCPWEDRYK